jgi:hypothetical protein
MKLGGTYQGGKIYIQNPKVDSSTFCVTKVIVNKQVIPFQKESAFAIPLDSMNLKTGDSIDIAIVHHSGCMPKVLQKRIEPQTQTTLFDLTVDSTGLIKWKTKNEESALPLVIETFKWNRWVKVGEVDGKGGSGENNYSFTVHFHSGTNRFRIKKRNMNNQYVLSNTVDFPQPAYHIKVIKHTILSEISFNKETEYELYDQEGNLVKSGFGKTIDCIVLPRGDYFLNFDNETTEIVKE